MADYVDNYISRRDRAEDKVNYTIGYLEMMLEMFGHTMKPNIKQAIEVLIARLKAEEFVP